MCEVFVNKLSINLTFQSKNITSRVFELRGAEYAKKIVPNLCRPFKLEVKPLPTGVFSPKP